MAALAPGGIRDLVSAKSARYKELGLADQQLSDQEWLELLAHEPKLLRRPLLFDDVKLVIGYDERKLASFLPD